jgi:hypothetical protein
MIPNVVVPASTIHQIGIKNVRNISYQPD